jgi:hypothetical protein
MDKSRPVDKKIKELPDRLDNVLKTIDIKQVNFALECKINPGTLSKAIERLWFSDDIVDKIHDRYKVRKGYWKDGKEPIIEGNGTYVKLPTGKKKEPDEEIRLLIKNLDRMGELNEYLLKELKRLQGG